MRGRSSACTGPACITRASACTGASRFGTRSRSRSWPNRTIAGWPRCATPGAVDGRRSEFERQTWYAYELLQALDLISLAVGLVDTAQPTQGGDPVSVPRTLARIEQPPGARSIPAVPVAPGGPYIALMLRVIAPGEVVSNRIRSRRRASRSRCQRARSRIGVTAPPRRPRARITAPSRSRSGSILARCDSHLVKPWCARRHVGRPRIGDYHRRR